MVGRSVWKPPATNHAFPVNHTFHSIKFMWQPMCLYLIANYNLSRFNNWEYRSNIISDMHALYQRVSVFLIHVQCFLHARYRVLELEHHSTCRILLHDMNSPCWWSHHTCVQHAESTMQRLVLQPTSLQQCTQQCWPKQILLSHFRRTHGSCLPFHSHNNSHPFAVGLRLLLSDRISI